VTDVREALRSGRAGGDDEGDAPTGVASADRTLAEGAVG
jgi:hypothetical protein